MCIQPHSTFVYLLSFCGCRRVVLGSCQLPPELAWRAARNGDVVRREEAVAGRKILPDWSFFSWVVLQVVINTAQGCRVGEIDIHCGITWWMQRAVLHKLPPESVHEHNIPRYLEWNISTCRTNSRDYTMFSISIVLVSLNNLLYTSLTLYAFSSYVAGSPFDNGRIHTLWYAHEQHVVRIVRYILLYSTYV